MSDPTADANAATNTEHGTTTPSSDWDRTQEVPLHVSHVNDARIHLLMGNPVRARELLSLPIPEITNVDSLHTVLRARHLFAEASLEIGTPQAVQEAIAASREGLELAATSEIAERSALYVASLYVTHAEALRRGGVLDGETIEGLVELLDQIATADDNRYNAIGYVGYRTLALNNRRYSALRAEFHQKARLARERFLEQAQLTPRDISYAAEPNEDKLTQPKRSALLSALIDLPYPSQGEAGWSSLIPQGRPRRQGWKLVLPPQDEET